MDRAWSPRGGLRNESVEESTGTLAYVVTALGVPLYAQHEVRRGAFAGLSTFDRFNNTVLRASRGDTEAVPGNANSLVVAGVDGESEEVILFGGFTGVQK